MFCEKCGAQLDNDAVFCEKCGSKVAEQANVPNETIQADTPIQAPAPAPLPKKQLAIAAVVAVVAIAIFLVVKNWKPTINLNDYIVPEYSGYNTVGTAVFDFDFTKFNEKYAGKLKYTDDEFSDEDVAGEFYAQISTCFINASDVEYLSNGDEVKFSWKALDEDDIYRNFKCKIKYEDTTFTVEGLEEVTTIDPFEKLDVTFDGIAPNGRIEVENNNDDPVDSLYFNCEDSGSLSNGDEVTVKVEYYGDDINKYLAQNYGVVLSPTEKTYTVEGLKSYVAKGSELSEDVIKQMQTQADDIITSVTAKWDDRSKLKSSEYVGYYLLASKDMDSYGSKNYVYMVYKFTESFTTDEYNPAVDWVYYYTVRFENVMTDDKGECSVDVSDYYKCSDTFTAEFKVGEDHHNRTYNTTGYQTLDKFVQECVSSRADNYTSETNIKQ